MTAQQDTVKVTNSKLADFRRNVELYLREHPAQFSRFLHALNKIYNKTKGLEEDFGDKDREINIEYAAKKDGYVIVEKFMVDRRGEKKEEEKFRYTAEGLKSLNEAKRKLLNAEVDVPVHQIKNYEDIPEDIDFSWWTVFSPFVLPEEPDEALLAKLIERTNQKTGKKTTPAPQYNVTPVNHE